MSGRETRNATYVTANVDLIYANQAAHELFLNDFHHGPLGRFFIGDGHPTDQSTDLDFTGVTVQQVREALDELMTRHPDVLNAINDVYAWQ